MGKGMGGLRTNWCPPSTATHSSAHKNNTGFVEKVFIIVTGVRFHSMHHLDIMHYIMFTGTLRITYFIQTNCAS